MEYKMRLKIEVLFKLDVWDKRLLLKNSVVDWTKAIMTDQGLDRVGDSYWISGVHLGLGNTSFTESSTGLTEPVVYNKNPSKDSSDVNADSENITWTRDIEYTFTKEVLGSFSIKEASLSWDQDNRTSTALQLLGSGYVLGDDEDLILTCRVNVKESVKDIRTGSLDFGASVHAYSIKPCFYTKFKNAFIGIPLAQKVGKVYSGTIPVDISVEPQGAIDTNLANFESYTFETRSKKFTNFFTLSSPNAVTRTATSHTIGLPSAYAVEFDPPIDKDFNREMTLNFEINWERG